MRSEQPDFVFATLIRDLPANCLIGLNEISSPNILAFKTNSITSCSSLDVYLLIFDDANDSVNISGFLFAYAYDQQIDVVNTSYVEYDENIGAALEYLVEGSTIVIPPAEQLTMLQKIPVDLDGDKENEVVYAINSGGNQDNPQRFSFLCYEDDGEIYRIISNTGNVNDSKMMHYYSIAQIMDLDGDNKKELIVRDIQYGTAAVERYMIYKQKDDDYQLISVET